MYLKLRVFFTILAAVFIAAVVPVGIFSWTVAIMCALAAFICFGLMLIFKQKQQEQENADAPLAPDFFSPLPKMDENGQNSNKIDEPKTKD